MPRSDRNMDGYAHRACKIRKRGCSSSSSSSILQNYRFKRAILIGKRCGSTTPVPTWKLNPGSPTSMASFSQSSQYQPSHFGGVGAPVSARKLANALWEMNKIPSQQLPGNSSSMRSRALRMRGRTTISMQQDSLLPHLSDPSHSPSSEVSDRSRSSSHRRTMTVMSAKCRSSKHNNRALDLLNNASQMEDETHSQGLTPRSSVVGTKNHLKDLNNGLTTSAELLSILNRIMRSTEQHPSIISLVSALHTELNQARVHVGQLIKHQRSQNDEVSYIKKRFVEEKSMWKSKEQERIKSAVKSIMEELDSEKKLRRQAERLNKKLGLEVGKMKALLLRTTTELNDERRSRETIEQVCDEIVKGIGEDKAEVEEIKRQAANAREDLEKEREMLQLADVWREERVQMKLLEAKLQFEEKNAAVDQLRNELEAYLMTKRSGEIGGGNQHAADKLDVENKKESNLSVDKKDGRELEDREDGEEEDGTDSSDSDLHSIELNMDSNDKSYSWSYATGAAEEEKARLAEIEEKTGSRTNCEHVTRVGKPSFILGKADELGQQLLSDEKKRLEKKAQILDQDCMLVKRLRDHMLSGSRLPMGCLGSPQPWGRAI